MVLCALTVFGDFVEFTSELRGFLRLGHPSKLLLGKEAGFDTPGERYFLLGVKKRDLTDLLEVVLNGVSRRTGNRGRHHRNIVIVGALEHHGSSGKSFSSRAYSSEYLGAKGFDLPAIGDFIAVIIVIVIVDVALIGRVRRVFVVVVISAWSVDEILVFFVVTFVRCCSLGGFLRSRLLGRRSLRNLLGCGFLRSRLSRGLRRGLFSGRSFRGRLSGSLLGGRLGRRGLCSGFLCRSCLRSWLGSSLCRSLLRGRLSRSGLCSRLRSSFRRSLLRSWLGSGLSGSLLRGRLSRRGLCRRLLCGGG